MAIEGVERKFKPFDILTKNQEEKIHQATLRVLSETGVTMNDERALKLMRDGGCKVDLNSKRVFVPEWLVLDCLNKCPSRWRLKARNENNDVIIGGGKNTLFSPSMGMRTLDLDTWIPREPTRKEFYDYVKILDWLPHSSNIPAFPFYGFSKVPQCMKLIESHAAKVRMSSKVQSEGSIEDNDIWNIEICKAAGMEMLHLCNPAAPLTYYNNTVDQIYRYTEIDMPFHFASGPLAGSTAPATIAGAVVLNNAEAIAGIVLTQLIKPGHRVWTGSMIMVQNMLTGSPAFGSISNSIIEAVFNQMWRRYKVPNWNTASAWVSSKIIDYQAAYECSMAAMSSALSGTSMVVLSGGLTDELTAHPVKAIIDDDIVGMLIRYLNGVVVNEETLGVDVINEVGPIPGHFLETAHTRTHWKKEQFLPLVADRLDFHEWTIAGKKNVLDHARERMEEIISTHKTERISPEQETAIEDILEDARKYYRKKGLISDEEWKIYQDDLCSSNYPYA